VKDGRTKGERYENTVCRLLSQWLVPGDWEKCPVYKLPFRRRFTDSTPLDGHWEGEGDILHRPDVTFPFCVECKDQEGWDLDGVLKNAQWPVWKWWTQACAQAQQVGLRPILFFTRAYRPNYVMIEKEVAQWLEVVPQQGPVIEVYRSRFLRSESAAVPVVTEAANLFAVPSTSVHCLSAKKGRSRSRHSRKCLSGLS